MSRALARRVQRLESFRRARPGLEATEEAWIRANCDEAEFLIRFVKRSLSGQSRRDGLTWDIPGRPLDRPQS